MKRIVHTCFLGLLILMTACDQKNEEITEIVIDTPDGPVVATSSEAKEIPQTERLISKDEAAQFKSWAEQSTSFLETYIGKTENPTLKDYDRAFKSWLDSSSRKHSEKETINILGSFLGQKMVSDFHMEWVHVTDQYGQDYAVRHKVSELKSFPFSSVAKRIEDRAYDFIHGVYHTLKHSVENEEFKKRK